MSWEQHRYAVERARDRLKRYAEEDAERNQMATLQNVAASEDANMLDDVADFLRSLEGSKRGEISGQAFVDDWNKTIATVSNFCAMYDLPKPDMIFHQKWRQHMSVIAQRPIGTPLIYAGVRVRFGTLESMDVLRP